MVDVTQAAEPCPFCGAALDTERRGNNPRHPDNDCFFSGQIIHFSQIAAWNKRHRTEATAELVEALASIARVLLPIDMALAQGECVDEPMPDTGVLLSFMGSGASDQVTAGEYREARAKLNAALAKHLTDGPGLTERLEMS